MKKMKTWMICSSMIILIIILLFGVGRCMFNMRYDLERSEEFTSPSGQTTLALRYDYVSRPYLFYKGDMVFAYDKAGFAENSFFDVEWMTEKEIRLYCVQFKEEYSIYLE